jgi:hypothetical protein
MVPVESVFAIMLVADTLPAITLPVDTDTNWTAPLILIESVAKLLTYPYTVDMEVKVVFPPTIEDAVNAAVLKLETNPLPVDIVFINMLEI